MSEERLKIYYATPIRGKQNAGSMLIDTVIRAAKAFDATIVSQHELITGIAETLDDTGIYQRDMVWLNQADCLIAEITEASTGVGYELYHAIHVRKIPVLCLYRKWSHPSAMITGIRNSGAKLSLREWELLGDAYSDMLAFLTVVGLAAL